MYLINLLIIINQLHLLLFLNYLKLFDLIIIIIIQMKQNFKEVIMTINFIINFNFLTIINFIITHIYFFIIIIIYFLITLINFLLIIITFPILNLFYWLNRLLFINNLYLWILFI